MSTLSSRQVSLSDHVKRRRSSAALSSYGNNNNASSALGSATGAVCGNSSSNGSGTGSNSSTRYAQHLPRGGQQQQQQQQQRHNHREQNHIDHNCESSEDEGGYDSHAASYGNYDAPSHYCRSYGVSDHGCYAAESYIGNDNYNNSSSSRNSGGNGNSREGKIKSGVAPSLRGSFSDPVIDLEGQRLSSGEYDVRRRGNTSNIMSKGSPTRRILRRTNSKSQNMYQAADAYDPALRMSQASTVPMGPRECSWEEDTATSTYSYPKSSVAEDSASYCPSAATVSTTGTSGSSSSGISRYSIRSLGDGIDQDAIRQGILDISTLVATYMAGALSFIIGIFLTLTSPFVRMVKCIVGDVRGLLGDAAFLQELGSLWGMYRELRRRSAASDPGDDGGSRNHHHHHGRDHQRYHHNGMHRYDDGSASDATRSTVYTEHSPQYVGGWQPRMSPSVGSSGGMSGSGAGSSGANTASTVGSSSANNPWMTIPRYSTRQHQQQQQHQQPPSRSQPNNLPLVYEDQYQDQGHTSNAPLPSLEHNNNPGGPQHHHHHNPNLYYPSNTHRPRQQGSMSQSLPQMPQYEQAYSRSSQQLQQQQQEQQCLSSMEKQQQQQLGNRGAMNATAAAAVQQRNSRPLPPRSRSNVV